MGGGDKKAFYPYGKSWKQVFARMAGAVDQFEEPEPDHTER